MAYDRYRQGQRDPRDYDRDETYSSARDYEAAGFYDRGNRGGYDQRPSGNYGRNDWNDRGGSQSYGQRDGGQGYGQGRSTYYGTQGYGQEYGANPGPRSRDVGGDRPYYGSYAHDGFRFDDPTGRYEDDNRQGRGSYGRQPQGYDYRERGFIDRAGDEVRSWFGDEDAERRRERDARYDQQYRSDSDDDYGSWRRGQIDALDRDYSEYRQENRTRFQNEFSNWRTERQGQRTSLGSVTEHMDVVGSDGAHVGTVDKVRGDRIVLTKTDTDAGGKHHSIPSRWIDKVDDKVTLRKTADEAHREWRDEERNQALFGDRNDRNRGDRQIGDDRGGHLLDRSFSGTY